MPSSKKLRNPAEVVSDFFTTPLKLPKFHPDGSIFSVSENEVPKPSQHGEARAMMREMLEAVLEENKRLQEEVLRLQNELDMARRK